MSRRLTIEEAQTTLPECIREIEKGGPLLIMRGEEPVAALVRPKDLEHLEQPSNTGSGTGLASLAGGWKGSDELVRYLEMSPRIGQRDVAPLDE